jgi:hypothetical protein
MFVFYMCGLLDLCGISSIVVLINVVLDAIQELISIRSARLLAMCQSEDVF